MGKVAIVAELSEDGLVQSEGVTHPGGGQVKDRLDGLFQHIIPVFAGPIGDVYKRQIPYYLTITLDNRSMRYGETECVGIAEETGKDKILAL